MGKKIVENWRIISATLVSVVLVFGAYVLARDVESPPIAQASTETALLQQIATKDSNGDGLPDWEKTLYGIPATSTTTDYFHLGMTDGEAVAKGLIVPKAIADVSTATSSASAGGTPIDYASEGLPSPAESTLTDAFTKDFMSLYLQAKNANNGAALSNDQITALSDEALQQLEQNISSPPDFKSASDISISATGAQALRAFAVDAEAVLLKNKSVATSSELAYFQAVVENNDTSAAASLSSLAKSYRNDAVGVAALPVPKELAPADLELINALMRMSQVGDGFQRVSTDPIAAIFALKQYQQSGQSLWKAFADVAAAYANAGVALQNGAPGASFVNVIPTMTEIQREIANQP